MTAVQMSFSASDQEARGGYSPTRFSCIHWVGAALDFCDYSHTLLTVCPFENK